MFRYVIPAKVGIQDSLVVVDPRLRGGDGLGGFMILYAFPLQKCENPNPDSFP